jgi:hypothetical protein
VRERWPDAHGKEFLAADRLRCPGGRCLIEGWSGGPDGDTALGFRICAVGFAIVAAVKFI